MGMWKHFQAFHKQIKLSKTDDAYRAARARDDSITQHIHDIFKDNDYPVIGTFIQGSFSTDTAIRKKSEDFDIDRAIVIDAETAPDDPVTVKIAVCDDVLDKRGFKNTKIKMPCVTADYASENLHIDIVVYRKNRNSYELAVGKRNSEKNNRKWEVADPKGLKDWIKDKSAYRGSPDDKLQQFNRIVRYLKHWRDERFSESVASKIYSIGITVMVKRCFTPSFDANGTPDDLRALESTVVSLLGSGFFRELGNGEYQILVLLPVEPKRDIFHECSVDTATQFRNQLKRLAEKLQRAIEETDEVKKCKLLAEIFGSDFPIPDKPSTPSDDKKVSYPSAGVVGTSQGA